MRTHPSINLPVVSWQTVQDAGCVEKLLSALHFQESAVMFPKSWKESGKAVAFFRMIRAGGDQLMGRDVGCPSSVPWLFLEPSFPHPSDVKE